MKIQTRTENLNKVRNDHKVPGVIYGKGFESIAVQADASEFEKLYREKGTSKTFDVTLEGKKHIVYIRELQVTSMNQHVLQHFDLVKVSKDDTMTSKVRISLLNKEVVEKKGLVINLTLDSVNLEYAVGKGISHLDIDVSHLEENDSLHVSDIVVPKGIKLLNDLSDVVLSVVLPREEKVEEEADLLEVDVETEEE
jgi:large subunit ribosomal protein L25